MDETRVLLQVLLWEIPGVQTPTQPYGFQEGRGETKKGKDEASRKGKPSCQEGTCLPKTSKRSLLPSPSSYSDFGPSAQF
jgi:hypothetical protein